MIIVAGGDSFVWGSELKDSPHGGPNGYSKNTFTALLAANNEYVCAAYPGAGNDSIARRVICEINKLRNNKPVVIVSWTFPGRYEFNFSFDKDVPNWQTINHWTIGNLFYDTNDQHSQLVKHHVKLAQQQGIYDFAVNYFRYVGSSEYWEIYSTFKEILFLQSFLQSKQIAFLFTCADTNFLYTITAKINDSTISALREQIDFSNWFLFPNNKGFYQWACDNKYPVGSTHPLEDAHKDAAELMKEKFYEVVTKYC